MSDEIGMRLRTLLIGIAILCAVLPTWVSADTFKHPAGNFVIKFNDNDFNQGHAEDLADALEQARTFYRDAGFPLPQYKIKVKLRARTSNRLGAFNPLTGNIRIHMLLDEDGNPRGPNSTRAKRRISAAHELFHAVHFASLPFTGKFGLGLIWVNAKINALPLDAAAEFWLYFEGMAEAMAWMVFPEAAANPAGETDLHGFFWFDPERIQIENCLAYPFAFIDPWRIRPSCKPSDSLEILGYYTVPFWLGLGQFVAGPAGTTYRQPATAIRDVLQRASPAVGIGGLDGVLGTAGMTRADIRDRLSLSAGVERFGDEYPHSTDDHWSLLFRNFERAGKDAEAEKTFLPWAVDVGLAPPNLEPDNTIQFIKLRPFLSFMPVAPEDGRLQSFNFTGDEISTKSGGLPAFAGQQQGINTPGHHPLKTSAVPPATIRLIDISPSPSQVIRPVVIAGFRDPRQTVFFPHMKEIFPGDRPTVLRLNNFRLRDLSVLKVLPHSPGLRYSYGFLGENEAALKYDRTRLLDPGRGDWIVRNVKHRDAATVSRFNRAVVMITPATIPAGANTSWMDSDIFDVVPRAEDTTTGAWRNTGTAQLSTHIASVPLPASPNERVRVDIARFDPGDHGGGRFFLTAVPRGKGDPPAPDLLVRAHTTKFRPEAVGKNGCEPTATIAVYVTNQGDADAINVSVRITGELATLVNQSQVATRQFDQNVMIGNFALGETRAWTIRVQAPARAYSFSIEGRINVDPSNTVSESVETNNDATVAPTDFACGRKIVSADTELMRLSENPGTLLDLENAISGRSAAFSANLRPVLDWIRDKGPRPETGGDPHRERLIERLAPMQDAGLFRHDVATFFASKKSWAKELRGSRLEATRKLRQRADTWLAARKKADRPAMKSYPGTLLATPAGLFVRDGTRLIPGDPSKPWALLDFGGNVPLSDIFLNGNQLDFDTQDGPLPVLPGRHRVRISNQENGRSHVWDIDLPSGKKRVLTIPVKIRKK